ncbi:hypothetical protein AA0112_g2621 [Alternaria arborescens]|uniref:hypothetical protein n=1 Tax=Alternaria arborescens TaxID=156630 RepID=UPI00107561D8|nr:hypothetical protein AA0111_g9418 [Alternaria arborescens]RYN40942.1 hypothetical protein AA0112_g2621 [Alternaria arborescens]RYO22010.1 hypothetical protein AA0111_g9418 [Alternaria arborescens]
MSHIRSFFAEFALSTSTLGSGRYRRTATGPTALNTADQMSLSALAAGATFDGDLGVESWWRLRNFPKSNGARAAFISKPPVLLRHVRARHATNPTPEASNVPNHPFNNPHRNLQMLLAALLDISSFCIVTTTGTTSDSTFHNTR